MAQLARRRLNISEAAVTLWVIGSEKLALLTSKGLFAILSFTKSKFLEAGFRLGERADPIVKGAVGYSRTSTAPADRHLRKKQP